MLSENVVFTIYADTIRLKPSRPGIQKTVQYSIFRISSTICVRNKHTPTLAHKCVQIQGPGLKKYNIFAVNYRNDENVVFKEHI